MRGAREGRRYESTLDIGRRFDPDSAEVHYEDGVLKVTARLKEPERRVRVVRVD